MRHGFTGLTLTMLLAAGCGAHDDHTERMAEELELEKASSCAGAIPARNLRRGMPDPIRRIVG